MPTEYSCVACHGNGKIRVEDPNVEVHIKPCIWCLGTGEMAITER